jgi:hypothetical protein
VVRPAAAVSMPTYTRTKTLVWYSGAAWTLTDLGHLCVGYLTERDTQLDAES